MLLQLTPDSKASQTIGKTNRPALKGQTNVVALVVPQDIPADNNTAKQILQYKQRNQRLSREK